VSLYLKYRPRSFADVVGQEHIVTTLEHAVERNQLVHAYLFFGPRGTGKTSVARILAKILLIRGIEDEEVEQQIVKSVDLGTMVDLIEIDAASNRGIDDVRELKEKVQFTPNIAAAKVYIIDEVHMMTKEAFNALLKTLEEPPKHTFFILATTELHKVPDTIQSRCQRFPFREVVEEDIVRALQNIADREHITIDRDALRAIARHVGGGMRDAVSLLDQLSSLGKITEQDVRMRIGESAEEYVDHLWEALDRHDRKGSLEIAAALEENGVSLEVFLRQLLTRARKDLHDRIEANGDTSIALERIDAIFQALKDLRLSPVPLVALEVALVHLCKDEGDGQEEKKSRREKSQKEDEPPSINHPLAKEPLLSDPAKRQHDATIVAAALSMEELSSAWEKILASVPTASVRMSLKDAVVHEIRDGKIILAFSSKFHRDRVEDAKSLHLVEEALKAHFRRFVPVECILHTSDDQTHEDRGKDTGRETVNIAEAALEIFGK